MVTPVSRQLRPVDFAGNEQMNTYVVTLRKPSPSRRRWTPFGASLQNQVAKPAFGDTFVRVHTLPSVEENEQSSAFVEALRKWVAFHNDGMKPL